MKIHCVRVLYTTWARSVTWVSSSAPRSTPLLAGIILNCRWGQRLHPGHFLLYPHAACSCTRILKCTFSFKLESAMLWTLLARLKILAAMNAPLKLHEIQSKSMQKFSLFPGGGMPPDFLRFGGLTPMWANVQHPCSKSSSYTTIIMCYYLGLHCISNKRHVQLFFVIRITLKFSRERGLWLLIFKGMRRGGLRGFEWTPLFCQHNTRRYRAGVRLGLEY